MICLERAKSNGEKLKWRFKKRRFGADYQCVKNNSVKIYKRKEVSIMLEPGMKAPEFTLKNQEGKEVSLSDYRGKKVILYFYSRDNTAGWLVDNCKLVEKDSKDS